MPRPRRDPARDETEGRSHRAGIPAGRGDLIVGRRVSDPSGDGVASLPEILWSTGAAAGIKMQRIGA